MPPDRSSAKVNPTGRYQGGAPSHCFDAALDPSSNTNAVRKTAPTNMF